MTAATSTADRPTGDLGHPARWRILAFVGIAQLMLILDVTVVALALPEMQADLGLSREAVTWVVSGYTLAFGGLLLLGGRAADLFGARRMVLAGLALFVASSLLAGLASTSASLLIGRVMQGIAAAILSPAALSIVVTIFQGDERNRALGIWSALGGTGAALGVLLGGVLTAGPGWPWVFIVNVPLGVAVIVLLRGSLTEEPRPPADGRMDLIGAVLVTAATGALIFALIRAGDHGWLTLATFGLVAASIALYSAFVARQRAVASPLVDLTVLRRRPIAVGMLLIFVATSLLITVFFLGTFYLQDLRGFGALETGALFLPVAGTSMLGANLAGRWIGTSGPRPLGVVGLLVAAAGMALPAVTDSTAALVVGMALVGAGTGAAFVVASATALSNVAPHESGLASGALSTFHEFGASVGAAVVSSTAALALEGGRGSAGFEDGYAIGAVTALVIAVVVSFTIRQEAEMG